jgi:YgiT-type zinc finger domain-containing protein
MEKSTTTYFSDLGSCIVVIKSVPCLKCTQCGEIAYPLEVGERLEQIIDNLRDSLTEVAIVNYSGIAA